MILPLTSYRIDTYPSSVFYEVLQWSSVRLGIRYQREEAEKCTGAHEGF